MAARSTAPTRETGTSGSRLEHYWAKRDFSKTSEPRGEQTARGKALSFVIQKHAARRLHYDFRLELDGVLVSWAVPKGPSYDPADKRLAVHVEDHPLSYGSFEGTIPPKQYGAGTVIVWDRGSWEPLGDPHQGLKKGKLAFNLHGQKMNGQWELVRMRKDGEPKEPWLLFKKRDEFARPRTEYDVVTALPDSVIAKPLKSRARNGTTSKPARKSAEMPDGATRAALPKVLSPQLATLVDTPPTEGNWIYEIKFDGYRILARIDKGKVSLVTRGGHDWASRMPHLVEDLKQLGINSAWLDGEIVVLGKEGVPDFNALQKAFDSASESPLKYFLFDVPFLEGYDLRAVELVKRRELLKSLLDRKATEHVLFSADFPADAASVLHTACAMHLEGVIAKRADAPYTSARTRSWLKIKCKLRQEFVICGYVDRSDDSAQIGSLLLGVHDASGKLVSVGRVGTGWDTDDARMLKRKLGKLAVESPPFKSGAAKSGRWRSSSGRPVWVRPRLVAEVEFSEWTPDGQIRHSAFAGLRDDKAASSIVRETAMKTSAGRTPAARKAKSAPTTQATNVKITHGERVIDATAKITKLDLVRYYESVAQWILPHLKGRPCSLVRGPNGIAGQLFFQKHGGVGIEGITHLDAALWPDHESLLQIDSSRALASAAQMNVIEFHTWNSTSSKINSPDRMVFDLDPGSGTSWGHVQEAATLLRALLEQLDLAAWLKTSGGKGLHVVVPMARRWDYHTVKDFSRAIVQHLATTIPSRFVARSGPANRVGKIFVDYLRNGFGATTAAAFSARARPGLGVSMPLAWDDLPDIKSGAQWTIRNAREHLSFVKRDPWSGYWKAAQSLSEPMKTLSFKPRRKL